MPRYAISDIHGCAKTFSELLRRIDLQREDELYLLGDYIDRGPDSMGVIEKVWQLKQEGYDINCLRGNHEEMLLDAFNGVRHVYDWSPPPRMKAKVWDWLEKLDHYFEIPGYVLVHAGLKFNRPDPLQDKYAMLWERYWYDEVYEVWPQEWLHGRIIVHGHTPERMLSIKQSIGNMAAQYRTCIDSGCAHRMEGMGYLTALNLDSREGTFVRCID